MRSKRYCRKRKRILGLLMSVIFCMQAPFLTAGAEGWNATDGGTWDAEDTGAIGEAETPETVSEIGVKAAETGEIRHSETAYRMIWTISEDGELTISDGETENPGFSDWWLEHKDEIVSAKVAVTNVTDMSGWFEGCSRLKTVDFSGTDTSKVEDMSKMFFDCSSLKSLDLSGFDTSNVTSMNAMFMGCTSLKTIDLSNFKTEKVWNMANMFSYCSSLKSADISGFVLPKEGYSHSIFSNCEKLESVNLDNVAAGGVYDLDDMFYKCKRLKKVDLSSFDLGNIEYMSSMFYECVALESVKFGAFRADKVKNVSSMFCNCSSLTGVDLSSFDFSQAEKTGKMFSKCDNLEWINTPKNVGTSIDLPVPMADPDGAVYTELPQGKAASLKLMAPGGLKVETIPDQIYTGGNIMPAIHVTCSGKTLVHGVDYTVSYRNNKNAASAGEGAKAPTAVIQGKGNYSGSTSVSFTILPKSLENNDLAEEVSEVRYVSDLAVAMGEKPNPILFYGTGRLGSKDYDLSTERERVTPPGNITQNGKLYVIGKGNFTGVLELDVTPVEKNVQAKLIVTQSKDFKPSYDGKRHVPVFGKLSAGADVEVSAQNVSEDLQEGKDFYVVYPANVSDAGTVKYTVVGMGKYTGTITKTYKIDPVRAEISQIAVNYDRPADGFVFAPVGVTVDKPEYNWSVIYKKDSASEGIVLKAGKDYKTSYSNNKKVGSKASIKLTFLGNYKGTKGISENFTIKAANLSDMDWKIAVPDMVYTKEAFYGAVPVVTAENVALKKSDYVASYEYQDANGAWLSMDKDRKLSLGERTSAMARVVVRGKPGGNYTETGVISKEYRISRPEQNQYDLSKAKITFSRKSYGYTGLRVEPAKADITVTCKTGSGMIKLSAEQYDLTGINNVNKGRATVVVTGNGTPNKSGVSFVGSKTASFTIAAADMGNVTVPGGVKTAGLGMLEAVLQ